MFYYSVLRMPTFSFIPSTFSSLQFSENLNFPIPFNLHFSIPFKFPSLKPSFIPTLQFPFPSAFNSLINFNFPSLQPSFLPTLNFPSLQPTILPTLQFPFPSTFISPNTSISLPINLHFSQHFNFPSHQPSFLPTLQFYFPLNLQFSKKFQLTFPSTFISSPLKELSLCNKPQFSNTYISTTKLCKPLIFQTLIVWYNRSNSLKYLRSYNIGLLRYWDLKIRVCGKDSIPFPSLQP